MSAKISITHTTQPQKDPHQFATPPHKLSMGHPKYLVQEHKQSISCITDNQPYLVV